MKESSTPATKMLRRECTWPCRWQSRVEDIAKVETLTPIQKEIVTALEYDVNADENDISLIALFENGRVNLK